MNKQEVMCELAFMYGNQGTVMDFEDMMDELHLHAENIVKVWFQKYLNVSPLQVVHDYFDKEILGK